MKNRFVLFFFILSIACTNCSECTERTDGACQGLETSSPDKNCEYDETTQACIEKECSDYDPNDCDSFHSTDYACVAKNGRCELIHCNDLSADNCYRVYSNSRVIEKSCLVKEDESGCELVKCEDLTAKCYKFYFGGGDTKCALNKEGTRCEPQKCSDLTENCEE